MTNEEANPRADGRTVKAAKTALAKKAISQESYAAVLRDELSIQEARELGREGSPGGATPPKPESRISKDDTLSPCLCGVCGELTPRTFKPGHDQRLVTYAKEFVRGERELTEEQRQYVERSGKLERAKAQVAKEEAKRREKAEAKAEKQRQKEGEAERKAKK